MDLALIEKLMRMLEQSDLETLDVEEGGMRIRLAKAGATPDGSGLPMPASDDPAQVGSSPILAAGISGTFYAAPSPGAAPFIAIGDSVAEGQQLGIIEAMKLLNPVEADRDGVIAGILVSDGQSVAPGTPLFEIGAA